MKRVRKQKVKPKSKPRITKAVLEAKLAKALKDLDYWRAAKNRADHAFEGMQRDRNYWKDEYHRLTEPKPFGLWTWPKSQQNQSLSRDQGAEWIGG